MPSTPTDTQSTLETIDLLQYRLQRLEYLLTGSDNGQDELRDIAAQGKDHGVLARLAKVENELARLASKSSFVNDILQLHSQYPDVFHPPLPQGHLSYHPPEVLTTSSTKELLAIITSCATSFPTTASRLTAIKDLPVPPAELSAALIALKPRIARVELLQESQGKEIAELRSRSALAIQRWYELSVLGGNECWTEWEGRLSNVEKRLWREEGYNAREAKENQAYST